MKNISVDGIEITIGQNQDENQRLLEEMKPEHSWFHIENLPSAHLTIPISYETIKKQSIYRIALELKKNSKYKKENNISVIYTHRKHLKLTNTPGKVITQNKIQRIKV